MIYIKLREILALIYSDILSGPSSFWDSLGDHVGTLDGEPQVSEDLFLHLHSFLSVLDTGKSQLTDLQAC